MAQTQSEPKKQPKSFEALTPELSSWILDFTRSMNFSRTTPVQGMAIPLLMGNKDLVVEAVTGSGKTLAFLIPIVERLLKAEEPNKKGYVRSIVVAPTKELAVQIYDVLRGLLEFHPASSAKLTPPSVEAEDAEPEIPPGPYVIPQLLVGGRTKLSEDLATFSSLNPNVLIGTPKRLSEVLGQSSKLILKRHWFDLLVLDEADRLLDLNFKSDLQRILDLVPKERRTGLFSASVSEAVDELVRVGMRYPFKISARVKSTKANGDGGQEKKTPESLKLYYLITKPTNKLPALRKILKERKAERTILYVSTRAGVDYWSHILPSLLNDASASDPVSLYPLHGDHKSAIRTKNLRRFRESANPAILITTDVLARGIDIPDIDLVVQVDPPAQPKDFIHRCGRSGRAGRRGIALTFLNEGSEEDYVRYLDIQGTKVEAYPNAPIVAQHEASEATAAIRKLLMSRRELHDRSQKAFVSWVQAYNKTLPSDIFDVKQSDWTEMGKAWGLLRWPRMPELKRHFPEAMNDRTYGLNVPRDFRLESLQYADKIREGKRQDLLDALSRGERPVMANKKLESARQRKAKAWSAQKEAKAVREARREKKEIRRKAERVGKMPESERLESMKLDDLVEQVRQRNKMEEDVFEGFGD